MMGEENREGGKEEGKKEEREERGKGRRKEFKFLKYSIFKICHKDFKHHLNRHFQRIKLFTAPSNL